MASSGIRSGKIRFPGQNGDYSQRLGSPNIFCLHPNVSAIGRNYLHSVHYQLPRFIGVVIDLGRSLDDKLEQLREYVASANVGAQASSLEGTFKDY